ncbi:MAG: CoA pyrophosphatase [Flavobacteriales bacterium]|nr:CoA pyrophosphatase [Flavobacteriales bacterium]
MTVDEVALHLRQAMRSPLPGHDGFLRLAGYKRGDIEAARLKDPPPRESAVLVLIYQKDDAAHTLLMVRPTYDGVHSGQVAFPGGRMEEGDASLQATALREFCEETGAAIDGIEVIGALTPLYIPPSRSMVTPYLAVTDAIGPMDPDPREVAQLIEAPLAWLLRDDILAHRQQYMPIVKREVSVPYFDVMGHVVWGATAMMIAELRELLSALTDPA